MLQSCPTLCDPMVTRLLCPWDSPEFWSELPRALLQEIFLTQRLIPQFLNLLHWQAGSLPLAPPGKLCTDLLDDKYQHLLSYQKNWCFWTVVLEKTRGSPLDCKEIKPVNPKGNQPWIFIARTDAEAEAPIFCPPDVKSWLIGKDPDAGKNWRQEEKGTTEHEMASHLIGWHHQLNGHEFEQALGDSERQGSLVCCSLWSCKESDTTEWLNCLTEYHLPKFCELVHFDSDHSGLQQKADILSPVAFAM